MSGWPINAPQAEELRALIAPQWRRTEGEDYSKGRNDMLDAIRAVLDKSTNPDHEEPRMTPTIGRIVIAKGLNPILHNGASEAPALITRAWGESGPGRWTVNARIVSDGGTTHDMHVTSRFLFDDQATADAWLADRPVESGSPDYLVWPARVGG